MVKEAIKLMNENHLREPESQIWRKIWRPKIILKVAFFVWLVVRNRLMTINNIKKRGIIMVNRCILCYHEEEDASHIFIHYDYT